LQCCESSSEERSAGNPHATICGNRRWATASGDPVPEVQSLRPTLQYLKADTVGRMAITGKTDFKRKVRSSMRCLQNNPGKIRSFYQKQSLKYAA